MGRVWFRARFACVPPFPVPVCGVGVRAGPGSRLCPALLGWVVRVCFLRFFFFWLCGVSCWVSLSRALWSVPLSPFFRAGLLVFFFSWCVSACFGAPFPGGRCSWLGVAGFRLVVPLCHIGGPVFDAFWMAGLAAFCVVLRAVWWLWAVFAPPPPCFFLGGGVCLFLPLPSLGWRTNCGPSVVRLVPRHSWRRFLCATPRHPWLGFAAGGGGRSSPLLAEGPGCGSRRLLAGVRWRRWCVVCWWGCSWCVVWLVPRHSWRRFLCATPCHSWLGFAAGGGARSSPLLAEGPWCGSPPLLAGVRWRRWCVVCGGGVLVGLWLVCGVVGPSPLLLEVPVCYSPPLLAGFRCRWWWAFLATPGGGSQARFPATPGRVSLSAVVSGVWCVVCGVRRWCVGRVVAAVWCGWSLTTPGGGSCVLLPATPGWVSLPVVVRSPRHSWLRVPGAVPRHSWLGSAHGGGVWCVAVVCWWGCGWCVVWLVPRHSWRRFLCATPRHSWLGFAAGGGGRSSPLLAEGPGCGSPPLLAGACSRRWCVVRGGGVLVGLWLVCGVVGPSPLLAEVPVCYSPPLLAGFRCRWWCAVLATPG